MTGIPNSSHGGTLSGARVFNSAALPVLTATDTALTFDSERYDLGNYHSVVSSTSRLTVPAAGYYDIGATIAIAANADTARRSVSLRVNGVTYIASQTFGAVSAQTARLAAAAVYFLAAGDYVECLAFQDSGVTLNVIVSANRSPEFYISLIGV